MSETTLGRQAAPLPLPRRALALIPGIALLAAIGLLGKWSEAILVGYGKSRHLALPDIEYVLWAIAYGLILANTVGIPRIFRPGIATYEFWLKIGVVFLGARFLLGDVLKLGGVSLTLAAITLGFSIVTMTWLGRVFGLKPKLVSLLAIGSSICGVSAIAAAKGAIGADDEDASIAIAAILGLGAISLVAFPLIGHWVHFSDHAYGLWAGLGVDNTAEATAAGALFSDEAGRYAVLAKTTRNATIGFVVLGYALYWAGRGEATVIGNKALFLWEKFPKFVLGFLALSLLATLHGFAPAQIKSLGNLSRWAFLLTFAGVGLSTDLRKLVAQGWRPLAMGLFGEVGIAAVTFGLVAAADGLSLL